MIGHRSSIQRAGAAVKIQANLPRSAPPALKAKFPVMQRQITAFWSDLSDASLELPDQRISYKIQWSPKRGYHDPDKKEIRVSWELDANGDLVNDGHSVAIHEMGHGIESRNDRTRRAAQEFLQRRTVGERLQRLRNLYPRSRYRVDELTKKDRFPDAYWGKEYVNRVGVRYGTEITSMALQELRENAANLVVLDEESFWFALGQLAGERVQ
jgi:hypothetical protein